jgi:hypothetical protein
MNTEIRDIHFASHVDSVEAQIRWPSPTFHLTRWEALIGAVITRFSRPRRTRRVATQALVLVLCMGAFGCAGLGMQNVSSLTPELRAQHGPDEPWISAKPQPNEGMKLPHYASGNLGLWDSVDRETEEAEEREPAEGHTTSGNGSDHVRSDTYSAVSAGTLFSHTKGGARW